MSTLATGLTGALGGLLGQAGEMLSAPRRALWSALGAGEGSGAELAGATFGLDPEGTAAQLLGVPMEIAGDPLTWAGAALGSPLVRYLSAPWQRARQAQGQIDALRGVQGVARGALAEGEAASAAARAQVGPLAESFAPVNLPAITQDALTGQALPGTERFVPLVHEEALERLGPLARRFPDRPPQLPAGATPEEIAAFDPNKIPGPYRPPGYEGAAEVIGGWPPPATADAFEAYLQGGLPRGVRMGDVLDDRTARALSMGLGPRSVPANFPPLTVDELFHLAGRNVPVPNYAVNPFDVPPGAVPLLPGPGQSELARELAVRRLAPGVPQGPLLVSGPNAGLRPGEAGLDPGIIERLMAPGASRGWANPRTALRNVDVELPAALAELDRARRAQQGALAAGLAGAGGLGLAAAAGY